MTTPEPLLLKLRFLGEPMATLAYRADLPAYAFEFDRTFVAQGHDLRSEEHTSELQSR